MLPLSKIILHIASPLKRVNRRSAESAPIDECDPSVGFQADAPLIRTSRLKKSVGLALALLQHLRCDRKRIALSTALIACISSF
jgi:hypothetical protein